LTAELTNIIPTNDLRVSIGEKFFCAHCDRVTGQKVIRKILDELSARSPAIEGRIQLDRWVDEMQSKHTSFHSFSKAALRRILLDALERKGVITTSRDPALPGAEESICAAGTMSAETQIIDSGRSIMCEDDDESFDSLLEQFERERREVFAKSS